VFFGVAVSCGICTLTWSRASDQGRDQAADPRCSSVSLMAHRRSRGLKTFSNVQLRATCRYDPRYGASVQRATMTKTKRSNLAKGYGDGIIYRVGPDRYQLRWLVQNAPPRYKTLTVRVTPMVNVAVAGNVILPSRLVQPAE
jgi:hypothetical protein